MERVDSRRLGVHLKRLREERKLTLGGVEALSEGFGERINKSYLFRVERGRTVPSIPRLRALAKVYRVKLATLVEALETSFEEQEKEASLGMDLAGQTYESLKQSGIDAIKEGDFTKAALLFRTAWDKAAVQVTPDDREERIARARHMLSIALRNAGNLELARENAEAALEGEGLSQDFLDEIRLNLAVVYRRLNRLVLSKEILAGLLSGRDKLAEDTLAGAHMVMGSIQLSLEPREAASHYRAAYSVFRLNKNVFEECKVLFDVGLAESKGGNLKRALKALFRALEIAKRKDYTFWICKIQTEIGKTYYLQGLKELARSAMREANSLARRGEYYEQLFLVQFYLRKMSLEEGTSTSARTAEASMRFFATRLEESFEEIDEFKRELEARKEERL